LVFKYFSKVILYLYWVLVKTIQILDKEVYCLNLDKIFLVLSAHFLKTFISTLTDFLILKVIFSQILTSIKKAKLDSKCHYKYNLIIYYNFYIVVSLSLSKLDHISKVSGCIIVSNLFKYLSFLKNGDIDLFISVYIIELTLSLYWGLSSISLSWIVENKLFFLFYSTIAFLRICLSSYSILLLVLWTS